MLGDHPFRPMSIPLRVRSHDRGVLVDLFGQGPDGS